MILPMTAILSVCLDELPDALSRKARLSIFFVSVNPFDRRHYHHHHESPWITNHHQSPIIINHQSSSITTNHHQLPPIIINYHQSSSIIVLILADFSLTSSSFFISNCKAQINFFIFVEWQVSLGFFNSFSIPTSCLLANVCPLKERILLRLHSKLKILPKRALNVLPESSHLLFSKPCYGT